MRSLLVLALVLAAGCRQHGPFVAPLQLAGGTTVPADVLNDGHEAYLLYCYACHGEKGDGRGPASPGMRPPPRDFTLGVFKFAGVAAGNLPHDDDLVALIHHGLDGTSMLPWDVPESERRDIVQYLKTFSPLWKEQAPGDLVMPDGPDPWASDPAGAQALGEALYHVSGARMTDKGPQAFAGCNTCHPSYLPRDKILELGRRVLGKEPPLRPDLYSPAADKVSDFAVDGHRLLATPTDFLFQPIKNGTSPLALYRTIACGIGGTAMPTWKGILKDADLWALAHYVRSLADLRGTPAATALAAALSRAP